MKLLKQQTNVAAVPDAAIKPPESLEAALKLAVTALEYFDTPIKEFNSHTASALDRAALEAANKALGA